MNDQMHSLQPCCESQETLLPATEARRPNLCYLCCWPPVLLSLMPACYCAVAKPAAAALHVPAVGERTNLRAGQACAATAHLYLQLVVPNLLGRYLPAYARFSVCSPALYLLSTSPAVAGPDSTLEALAGEVQATTARCVWGGGQDGIS